MKALVRLLAVAIVMLFAGAARAADWYEPHSLDQVMGKPDAPVTIIEYASTTCPHCATFHKTLLPRIKQEWIDTGKAKLVYRDFPTSPAALSIGASMIAQCAGPMRYFGVLGMLFDQQDRWMSAKNPLDELKRIARVAGMNDDAVDACLKRQDLANAIQERAEEGYKKYNVDSTPSLVIDGKAEAGVRPYEEIDALLKKAAAKK